MPPKITRVRWVASNLPWGISFNEQTGIFTGTPDKDDVGEYDIPVTVETNFGRHQEYVKLKVREKVEWDKIETRATLRDNSAITYHPKYGVVAYCRDGSYYYLYGCSKGDLTTWNTYVRVKDMSSGDYVGILYGIVTDANSNYVYCVGSAASGKIIRASQLVTSGNNFLVGVAPPVLYQPWCAACYASSLNTIFYVSRNGYVVKFKNNTIQSGYKSINHGSETNDNCVAYSTSAKKLCVSIKNSTVATSTDGDTWEIGDAPDNLLDLEYRTDLSKFFARGENTKLFYVSDDGLSWVQYNNTPIPLVTVKSLAYSQSYGYCAVGQGDDGTEQHSVHSVDGESWKSKKITDDDVSFVNVIFAPGSFNAFIAKPVSSTKYLYLIKGIDIDD